MRFYALVSFFLLAANLNAQSFKLVSEFKSPKGWFLVSDTGTFMALDGYRDPLVLPLNSSTILREARFFSNVQPYVGMMVGYDVLQNLAIALKIGRGYVTGAARNANNIDSPSDYALTFFDAAVTGIFPVYHRLSLRLGAFMGIALMTPPVLPNVRSFGFDVGAHLGLHYNTLLSGLFVGVDLNARMSLLAETKIGILPGIVSISLIPLIGYVF